VKILDKVPTSRQLDHVEALVHLVTLTTLLILLVHRQVKILVSINKMVVATFKIWKSPKCSKSRDK
jgi:hypothetical protein